MSKHIKTKEDLVEFWEAFSAVYGEGIYIKSDMHPCGWDWVDLTFCNDMEDLEIEPLTETDFSNGSYKWHPFQGQSVFSMLKEVGENWCFERNAINWS